MITLPKATMEIGKLFALEISEFYWLTINRIMFGWFGFSRGAVSGKFFIKKQVQKLVMFYPR